MVMSVDIDEAPALPTSYSVLLIARLARTVKARLECGLAPLGLRVRHLVALSYLRDHGPTPQGALGDGLRIDPSNLVGLLNDLDRQDLVVRRRDPADRRRHIVELSPRGEKLLDEDVQRTLQAVDDDVLGSLALDDRADLHRILMSVAGELAAMCLGEEEEACAP
jgi:DNA-binding MarR family transcriptional regulator